MFGSLNTFRSTLTLTRSRLALAGASLAAIGAAAPMMGAGPWDWYRPGRAIEVRVEPRREVRIEYRPQVVAIAPAEIAPCDMNITAYQSRGTIMIFAAGSNRTGGYRTSLRALDSRESTPRIMLSNIAPAGCATQAISPFSINAAIHTERTVSTIDVLTGGRVICVPVQQVAGIA